MGHSSWTTFGDLVVPFSQVLQTVPLMGNEGGHEIEQFVDFVIQGCLKVKSVWFSYHGEYSHR